MALGVLESQARDLAEGRRRRTPSRIHSTLHHMVFSRLIGLSLAVLSLGGCAGGTDQVSPSPASNNPSAQFRNRPLTLLSLPPNAPCPVSAQVTLPTAGMTIRGMPVPTYGFGPGPVYLSGQLTWYAGQVSLFLIGPRYAGAALARGHRLDGTGGFPFAIPNGELTLAPARQSSQWRLVQSSLLQAVAPGCYGVQIDGDNFSEVIVFTIQAGPAPPN